VDVVELAEVVEVADLDARRVGERSGAPGARDGDELDAALRLLASSSSGVGNVVGFFSVQSEGTR
jgi:hypothetical protein